METLSNDTVHASISIAPNNAHIDVQNIDELSKEKEEELLYGTGEDGDEEDALSDDSLRLRLSDDEAEIEDITPKSVNTPNNKQQTKDMDEESKVECAMNLQPLKETDTSKTIVIDKKNVNCKLTKMEDVVSDVQINCNDSKSLDNLNDSKSLNNLTSKEKERQSNVKSQNGKIDTNKEDDQCHNTGEDSAFRKEEELLNNDCNTATVDHENVQNSTSDEHSTVKNSEDKQENDCTQTIQLNQCQKNSDNEKSKNTRLSSIKNGKSKTTQENCLASDQKISNTKHDEKILNEKDGLFQTSASYSKKETEKLNSPKVITEDNSIENTNQSASATINVDSDVNECVANSVTSRNTSSESTVDTKSISDDSEKKTVEASKTQRKRRRSRKLSVPEQDLQENKEEAGRQKRKTAKNAEEIIRKKFLVQDSDIDSSDSSEKLVIVNYKIDQHVPPLSPPSLKRNCPDNEVVIVNGSTKKQKRNSELKNEHVNKNENMTLPNDQKNDVKGLNYIQKFFRRDLKEKLPKLKQEELEELLIQKIVETITMRSEIGKLREQARLSEKSQEATRTRCQQLAKQIKDFEMVLSRHAADRRANNDKPTPPIKINRSVGLQVNFVTDHGVQSLRQLQQNSALKSINIPNNASTSVTSTANETNNNPLSPRKGIKVRSPRRLETSVQPVVGQAVTVPQSSVQPPPLIPAVTPAALVVTKTVESQHSVNLQNQNNSIQQIIPNQQQSLQTQTVVLNGKIQHQANRQSTTLNVSKTKTNDLIDLTDEEEKSKSTVKNKPSLTITAVTTSSITDSTGNILSKAQPCFPRVIQTLPANVAITSQPASIRVVHTASHPTPTALVNNMNASRLAYVMQGGVGSATQLLITSSTNQIRPVTSSTRSPFTTVAYKAGISTNANGTVRVITTSSGPNVQLNKHPAPLPDSPHYAINSASKLPPPAPSLKISKVANGIVLSWNMVLSDKYADIVSYQLYAYQEVAGVPPSTNLWKKVGDVRALPLPMACTLTQFSEGNNYYFAVRAVDTHSRKGQYSIPGNISL